MATEHSNGAAGATGSAAQRTSPRLEAPSPLAAVLSVGAVLCMCAVVWTTYAAFGQQSFDVQETVLHPLAAWVASATKGAETDPPNPDHLTVARTPEAARILR